MQKLKIKIMDKKILEKWDNTCIKVLSEEHGKKVIDFWKSVGVDTMNYDGCCRDDYYGIFDGRFNNWEDEKHLKNQKIITLEEAIAIRDKHNWKPQFGEEVEVSMEHNTWWKRIFVCKKNERFHCVHEDYEKYFKNPNLTNDYLVCQWNYIRKIEEPKKIEISLEEAKQIIAKEKGISVEQVNLNFKIN